MKKKFEAGKSLYGEGHANATRARECVAMPGVREQTVLTPDCVLERVRKLWGHIELDPCSSGQDNVGARDSYTVEDDGLSLPWRDKTFWNPPYAKLKDWVAKERQEGFESIGLIPARTHRKWLDLSNYDCVCFMYPLKFVGFKQAFPAPLLLVYRGDSECEFAEIFSDLGMCVNIRSF